MQGLLDFDQSPPFAAPLRFFLAGPVFGMLAGALIALDGGELFSSRWMPATLALTHLVTLGFMLHVMVGALIQVLPVIAGVNLPHPQLLSRLLQPALSLSTLALVGGFLFSRPAWLQVGGGCLLLAITAFVVLAGQSLWRVRTTSPTILALKLALPGLLVTVALGFWLLQAMLGGTAFSLSMLTDLHATWGFAAWAGVLLAGLSCVVVPMFQLTPAYPARPSWVWPWVICISCIAALFFLWFGMTAGERVVRGSLSLLGLAFVGFSLKLQGQRRRARADATLHYWQLGLWSCLAALVMVLFGAIWPEVTEQSGWSIALGVLLLGGGFVSLIIGMLYKIIPFLAWMHLQQAGEGMVMAPNMNQLLGSQMAQRQFLSHCIAVALVFGAIFWPAWLTISAGVLLLISQAWLLVNLVLVVRAYRSHLEEIRRALSAGLSNG